MYLKSVTLRDWGCHDDLPVVFEDGLNICIGPNGAGKSTLYHAIVAALTFKHSTQDRRVLAFKSWGRDGYGPTASMEIVRDDGVWSLTKTFLHAPQCLLERNHGDAAPSRFKGPVAEQELDRWLEGDGAAGRLILTLWSNQNDPIRYEEVPGAKPGAIIPLVERAIAQAVRPDASGPLAMLKKTVATEYDARITEAKMQVKVGSELDQARQSFQKARQTLDELQAKQKDLAARVEEYRTRLARHDDDCRTRDDLRRQRDEREGLAREYQAKAEALKQAEQQADKLRARHDTLKADHDHLNDAELRLAGSESKLRALAPRLEEARIAFRTAETSLRAAEARHEQAHPRLEDLARCFERNDLVTAALDKDKAHHAAEDAARSSHSRAVAALSQAEEQLQAAEAEAARADRAHADALNAERRRDLQTAEAVFEAAEADYRLALAADLAARRVILRERLEKVRALSDALARLGNDGDDGPVPMPAELQALADEHRSLEHLARALDADSLTVRLVADAPLKVRLSGDGGSPDLHELAGGQAVEGRGAAAFSIVIEGVGRIDVGRSVGEPSARIEPHRLAREALAERLKAWGTDDLAELERRHARSDERRKLAETRAIQLDGRSSDELEASLAALDSELQALGVKADDPPPPAPSGAGLKALDARRNAASHALVVARSACPGEAPAVETDPPVDPAESQQIAEAARKALEAARGQCQTARLKLAGADADLKNAIRQREETRRELIEATDGQAPADFLADIQAQVDRARSELEALGAAHLGVAARGSVQLVQKQLDDTLNQAREACRESRDRLSELDTEYRLAAQARDALADTLGKLRERFALDESPESRRASLRAREIETLQAEAMARHLLGLLPADPSADRESFQKRWDEAETRCHDGEVELARLLAELTEKGAGGLDTQVARAEEQFERCRNELDRTEREASAWALLHHLLGEVEAKQSLDVAAKVQALATGSVRQLTAGTADEVIFDARTLVPIKAKVPGRDLDAGLEQFSRGTREQVALACRLQVGLLLSKNRFRHMLLLDDPLAHTDADRLKAALEIFTELRKDLQLIIFTCHEDRYRALGDLANFVDLRRTHDADRPRSSLDARVIDK